jgi:hypothetical protein
MARISKRRNTWIPPSKEMKDGQESGLVVWICVSIATLALIVTAIALSK